MCVAPFDYILLSPVVNKLALEYELAETGPVAKASEHNFNRPFLITLPETAHAPYSGERAQAAVS